MARRKNPTVVISLDLDEGAQRVAAAAERAERIAEAAEGFGESLSAALTAPLALLGAPALAAAESYRVATADIRAATGATGESLDGLVSVLRDVRQESGVGMGDASRAIAELSRGFGLTGDSLREATIAVTRVAQASGGASSTTASSVVRAMRAFGEQDGARTSEAAAQLFEASRRSGQGFDAIADQLAQAAPTLRAAGLSLGESSALIADLGKRGVPAERALDGLRTAITSIVREGGRDIPGALRKHIDAIRSARSAGESARLAADLFGKSGVEMSDAIRRGALDLDRLPEMLAGITGPERVDSVALAFARLRASVEAALAPLGGALSRVLESAAETIAGAVHVVTEAARWFGSLPESLQSAVVVVAMIAVLAGPALAMGGIAAGALSGAALSGIKLLGAGRVGLALALAGLVSAGVGLATSAEDVEEEANRVTRASPTAALSSAGAAVQRAGGPAVVVEPLTIPTQEIAQVGRDMGVELSRLPRVPVQMGSISPMPPIPRDAIDTRPIDLPAISVPGWTYNLPQIQMPAQYDWQGEVSRRIGAGPSSSAPSTPEFPLFFPAPDEDLAGAMRAHSGKVSDWWTAMRGMNAMPLGPLMPGSWLASNTPEEWARRADELDQVMRRNRQRDDFWSQAADRRQQMDMDAWHRNNDALMSSPYGSQKYGLAQVPMGQPQIYSADDVLAAVTQGWEQATGAWRPLSEQGGAPSGGAPAAAPPPAAEGPATMSFYGDLGPVADPRPVPTSIAGGGRKPAKAPAAPPNLPAIARPSSGPEFLRMEGQKYVYSGADATGRRHEIKTEIPYMRPIGIEDFKRARRAFEAVGRLDPDIAARVKVLAKFNPRAAQDPDVAWALKESLKPAGVR